MQPNIQKQSLGRDFLICLGVSAVGYILLRLPVGINEISVSFGVCALYLAAYLLPCPTALFCTVLPAVAADVIWGSFLLIPMTLVVTAVCQLSLCWMFDRYVQNNLGRFLLAAGVGGVFFMVGTFFYFAVAYGMLEALLSMIPYLVQWIFASVLGYWAIALYRSKLLPKLK